MHAATTAITLTDGTEIAADAVVIAAGYPPGPLPVLTGVPLGRPFGAEIAAETAVLHEINGVQLIVTPPLTRITAAREWSAGSAWWTAAICLPTSSWWPSVPCPIHIPGVSEDQDRRYYAVTIKPTVFVNLVPDHVIIHRMFSTAADHTIVDCGWLYLPGVLVPSEHHIGAFHDWIQEKAGDVVTGR
jgi:hypothetical protein